MSAETSSAVERWLKIAGIALTFIGLLAGVYQFARTESVAAARPFLERKLKWCEEAVEVAAGIAVYGRESLLPTDGASSRIRRVDRFWALYWGSMGMVESQEVTAAMVAFGEALKSGTASSDNTKALAIAHACRSEMARDWSSAWNR